MTQKRTFFVLVGLGALILGCGSSGLAPLASQGKLDELRRGMDARKGSIPPKELAQVGRATLGRALTLASGKTGEVLVESLDECASELVSELEERSKKEDDVGFEAAQLLLEHGKYSVGRARSFQNSSAVGGRALWVRTLTDEETGEQRRQALVDPESRVRRAALGAASVARDPADIETLLEVARLDPDEQCRTQAYKVLAVIGGEGVSSRLFDRYAGASEPEKLSIIDAWAGPRLLEARGEEFLVRTMNLGPEAGYLRLEAAARLARTSSKHAPAAEALLLRTLHDGTTGERNFAVVHVALSDAAEKELAVLLGGADRTVAIVAAARLLDASRSKDKALSFLRSVEHDTGELGRRARAALSTTQSPPSEKSLLQGLNAPDQVTRLSAGRALLRMHRYGESATLLSDSDEHVRVVHACALLRHLGH